MFTTCLPGDGNSVKWLSFSCRKKQQQTVNVTALLDANLLFMCECKREDTGSEEDGGMILENRFKNVKKGKEKRNETKCLIWMLLSFCVGFKWTLPQFFFTQNELNFNYNSFILIIAAVYDYLRSL